MVGRPGQSCPHTAYRDGRRSQYRAVARGCLVASADAGRGLAHPVEVAAMERLRKSLDWVDVVRRHHPPPQKLFSWWSYRAHDWAASDRGRRLDHIWTSPSLASSVRAADILKPVRGWDQPSDHVPVTVDFD